MKFGDIVMSVASMAVITILIGVPLGMVLIIPFGEDLFWGYTISNVVSILLGAIITGYYFAGKIWEARMEAITKIAILSAVLAMFSVTINTAALADWTPMVKETYLEANPTATLSTSEWVIVEAMSLAQGVFSNAVIVLVLAFIGLYVGSMFRGPVKS